MQARFVVLANDDRKPVAGRAQAVFVQIVDETQELARRDARAFRIKHVKLPHGDCCSEVDPPRREDVGPDRHVSRPTLAFHPLAFEDGRWNQAEEISIEDEGLGSRQRHAEVVEDATRGAKLRQYLHGHVAVDARCCGLELEKYIKIFFLPS